MSHRPHFIHRCISMKILLADDHQLIFNGIQALLEDHKAIHLIPQLVQRVSDLLPEIQRQQPDILLLDVNLRGENALNLLPEIKKQFPKLRVLVISTYTQNSVLEKATVAGADAFLTKDLTLDELLFALQHGQTDRPYISEGVGALHPEKYLRRSPELDDPFIAQYDLSRRELEMIRFVVAGMTTEAIAEALYLSPHTVHTHRRNVLQKLGLHSTAALVKWALEYKLA